MPNAEDQVAPCLGRELERGGGETPGLCGTSSGWQAPLADAAHIVRCVNDRNELIAAAARLLEDIEGWSASTQGWDSIKKLRDLILRVWHVDPLRCSVCQNPMRVLAVIDDPRVVEKILRHLGAWHDPPARPPPQGVRGPY